MSGNGVDLIGAALAGLGQFLGGRQQLLGVGVRVLGDVLEVLVALLVGLGLGQIAADALVLPQEGLAVVLQPVQHLLHVVLEQPQRQLLVQFDLLLAPLLLQLSKIPI